MKPASTQTALAESDPRGEANYLQGDGIPGMVSVVIPTHNRALIVGAAIESVLAQTHGNVEVIVVDDGSTDDTKSAVERYGPRVRYVYQPNGGVSSARNRGFANTRGEFIALLDSDDAYVPWKLEAQVRFLQAHPDVGMVWTDMTAVTPDGRVVEERYLRTFYDAHALAGIEQVLTKTGALESTWIDAPSAVADAPTYKGDLFSSMLLGNLVHTSTVVIRRNRLRVVGGFDPSLRPSGEDYEFHLRTCSHGPVAFIDAPSLLYRIGAEDQLTAPRYAIHIARNNLTTVLRWLELGRERITLSKAQLQQRLADSYRWVGEAELERGERRAAIANLWRSLRYAPRDLRTAKPFVFAFLPPGVRRGARAAKRRYREMIGSLTDAYLGSSTGPRRSQRA